MEKVKRLAPTKEVLRELYLKSGNQCAFPGCKKAIINDKGIVVGEICHIEAAMPGGQRFNPKQSNEDRRAFSNLILLCHDHHLETDNVVKFTVGRLQKMKEDHEKNYSDAADKLFNSISDKTLQQEYEYCTSLANMNNVIGWGYGASELAGNVKVVNEYVNTLRKLAPETRSVFSIMVDRAHGSEIIISEIEQVTGLSGKALRSYIQILNTYKLITWPEENDDYIYVTNLAMWDGCWDIWYDIKQYSEQTSISLQEIIYNMRFSLLD